MHALQELFPTGPVKIYKLPALSEDSGVKPGTGAGETYLACKFSDAGGDWGEADTLVRSVFII